MPTIANEIPIDQLPAVMAELADAFEGDPLDAEIKQCGDVCRRDIASNYQRSGSPLGSWPPRKDTLPHPLLILSGAMRAASVDQGGRGHIEEYGHRSLTMGVNASSGGIIYAMVHQFGYPARNIPPRPFIVIGDEAIEDCEEIIGDGLFSRLR